MKEKLHASPSQIVKFCFIFRDVCICLGLIWGGSTESIVEVVKPEFSSKFQRPGISAIPLLCQHILSSLLSYDQSLGVVREPMANLPPTPPQGKGEGTQQQMVGGNPSNWVNGRQ